MFPSASEPSMNFGNLKLAFFLKKKKKNCQQATRKVLRARVKYWYTTYKILIFLDDSPKFWDFKSQDYQLLLRIKQKLSLPVCSKVENKKVTA